MELEKCDGPTTTDREGSSASYYEQEDTSCNPHLAIQDELSASSLAALMQFQEFGYFEEDIQDGPADAAIPKDALCVAYTAKDSQVIADTLRRLQRDADDSKGRTEAIMKERILLDLDETVVTVNDGIADPEEALALASAALAAVLAKDGVARINGVLSPELCDRCLADINEGLVVSYKADNDDDSCVHDDESFKPCDGFGNVHSRNHRYDMYLRNEGSYGEALNYMLGEGTALKGLFHDLLDGESGTFHELAALISDCGSQCQPIHPDSTFTEWAPLYTCFVALQDVDDDMGPTVFLPGTNTLKCHENLKSPFEKDEMLSTCEYRRALLKKGDVAIMDSRTFHCGDANWSDPPGKRRVLLYFTIRNPRHSETGAEADYPPGGSKFPDLHLTTHDF